MKKYLCEFVGTLVLVLFGCGAAAIGGAQDLISNVGVALAFGLAIVAMAYAIGGVSGCHVNPAVSLAMLINKKISIKDFCFYVVAQILGAFAGIGLLLVIKHNAGLDTSILGANGYGELSGINVGIGGAITAEIILTFVFVLTILGVTSDKKFDSIAGLVIGLTLTFVHILGIPVTGTSVNPARSLAPAVLVGGQALSQVWVFIVAPLLGAALAAYFFKFAVKKED